MMKNARMPVHEVNPYLTCVLCGGYLIDATTIIECLHSFCRTCIVHYLHTSNYCPVCECLVHKKYPHQNLRSDKTLQDVVYKLVPGLFMEEMRRRRKYYNVHTDESQSRLGRIIFSPEEKISLCMRLCTRRVCESSNQDYEFQDKRYLLCPAQMSVYHLKKFLRLKYSLSDRLEVELFHMDEVLRDEYSLVDVSYITGWTREQMMVLNYAFYENPNKKFKGNSYSGAVSPSNEDSGIEDENSNQDDNNPDKNHVTSQSSQASKENDNQQPSDSDGKPPDSPHAAETDQPKEDATDAVNTTEKDTDDVTQNTVNLEGKEETSEHVEKQNGGTDAEKHDAHEESRGKDEEVLSLNLPDEVSDTQRKVDVFEKDNHTVDDKQEPNSTRMTPSHESNSVAIEDDEGALQIVIDDSKSEKSSDDSGIHVSESSPNENDSVCSNESRSPSVPIKIPHPDMFKPPISYHNGEGQSKSPKTSTPFHSLNSPSSKYPRVTDSLGFNDSGFSSYNSFNDSIAQTSSSCPQTDFDTDEIWTDGVMDLSKPKAKETNTDCCQEVRSSVAEEEEEVENYTYVVDGLEGDGDMEIDSGYANENSTPERYSVLSPDQNEVTSTRMDHIPYHVPAMVGKPQFYNPKLSASSSLSWKGEKSEDTSKKSSKHHKRRKSSESSKHKVVLSNGHSKCTDVCNGHSVEPRSESSSHKKHQSEKFILNQPRCEKLIISQPRCEKAPKNKPRCEKLVVKLSKERNSENYTATMS